MTTPLDALVLELEEAAAYNQAAEAPPHAVIWCDANNEFSSLLPELRSRMPHLLTYGDFSLETRTGPAVWLRVAVAGLAPGISWDKEKTPIIYLPGIGREVLRGVEECPALLQPLVWYTVAGNIFGHVNGKDWTLRGFLSADRGRLRLNIADDAATKIALAHAAARFCKQDVQSLHGKRWDADALNTLLAPDLAADMLDWMEGALDSKDVARFSAFAALAAKDLSFDPRKLSRQDAARRLASRQGKWSDVWARFEASMGYKGIVSLLSVEEPPDMFSDKSPYPKVNIADEKKLREELLKLSELTFAEAKSRITSLHTEHEWRTRTIWARRGDAPLANAVKHLAVIAKASSLPSQDGTLLGDSYTKEGHRVDRAATDALVAAPRQVDRDAVIAALRAIYMPWVEDGATALQELVRQSKVRFARPLKKETPDTVLFVDGLRMDLAHALIELLAEEGVQAKLTWTWSGFPTVTATCKPLASPVAHIFTGPSVTNDVLPLSPEGKPVIKPILFKTMEVNGWKTEPDLIQTGKLWVETGRFDEEGHALGVRLADQLAIGLRDSADRILDLLRSGRSLRIVTDHGWLLMPGGLAHAALDVGLVEANGKRSRCAMVKSAAETSYLQVPWSWNDQVFIAAATGARAFFAGQEYAHGGISPQECILPIIDIDGMTATEAVSIEKAAWEGLRLRIQVSGGADLKVDVRLGAETSGYSLAKGGRVLDADGRTALLVSDDYLGQKICLVVMDENENILAHRTLTVGGE